MTVDPAFAARVNEVCDDLQLPAHGRQTALAQWMGLTPNAARKWLLGARACPRWPPCNRKFPEEKPWEEYQRTP